MLYVFYGADHARLRAAARKLTDGLLAKKPDASVQSFDDETLEPSYVPELVTGQGLFEQRKIVELNRIFSNAETREAVIAALPEIAQSPNIFVLIEETIDKRTLEKLSQVAEKVHAYPQKGAGAPASFNLFSLADALLARNRKALWMRLIEAQARQYVPEEIHGVLFWQLKALLLARSCASADAAGLKPFVYSKAKRAQAKFSDAELRSLSRDLVVLYHDAHRGLQDFEIGLERWVLRV